MKGKIEMTDLAYHERKDSAWEGMFSKENAEIVRNFHRSIPEYEQTPLVCLKNLAYALGVAEIYLKDESYRFGLNAFKGLGGSYSIARYIAERLDIPMEEMDYSQFQDASVKARLGEITFVTATDGNHGRGVAWTAHKLGVKSVVYLPKGSAEERLENIRALGADAMITDMNYDDTVRFAKDMAEKNGWVLIQDTAWEGYEKIPAWIMQGYMTMALEAVEELRQPPTHVFLQAGVGAMAGALTGFFADYYGEAKPIIVIVEPHKANCIYQTAAANDGTIHMVDGDLNTIMAGLACGEPCTIGWDVLQRYAEFFLSVPEYVAAKGMRILGNPLGDDKRVISGESGAATLGCAAELLQRREYEAFRKALRLKDTSRILCISTEGDTDKENYRKIVWDGWYAE